MLSNEFVIPTFPEALPLFFFLRVLCMPEVLRTGSFQLRSVSPLLFPTGTLLLSPPRPDCEGRFDLSDDLDRWPGCLFVYTRSADFASDGVPGLSVLFILYPAFNRLILSLGANFVRSERFFLALEFFFWPTRRLAEELAFGNRELMVKVKQSLLWVSNSTNILQFLGLGNMLTLFSSQPLALVSFYSSFTDTAVKKRRTSSK